MNRNESQKRLEEIEREADRRGCCIIPAEPITDPADAPDSEDAV